MTAEEYFRSRNGGKSLQEMERDGEQLSARWIMTLMKDYARCKVDEQRHLCFNNANWADIALEGEPKLEDQILNAPKPEME